MVIICILYFNSKHATFVYSILLCLKCIKNKVIIDTVSWHLEFIDLNDFEYLSMPCLTEIHIYIRLLANQNWQSRDD